MGLFSKRVALNPLLAKFADGRTADAKELSYVQDSLLHHLQVNEVADVRHIVTSRDGLQEPVLVVTGTRLLIGSARTGAMTCSVSGNDIGGISVTRTTSGGICLKVRLLRAPHSLVDGRDFPRNDLIFVRNQADALVQVAKGIDRIFRLEEPASEVSAGHNKTANQTLDEAWFIAWINGIEASVTPAVFLSAMNAQSSLEATTNGLIRACEQVFKTCRGMIQANCSPQSLESFESQVEKDWLNATPWDLITKAFDLDPTAGASKGEWEAAVRQVVEDELQVIRKEIVGR